MSNKEIFQKVLNCLGINSRYELPKPWSDFFAQNTPRIADTNSKEYNIFKGYNSNKILDMISVSMGLFTSEYCNIIMPFLYLDLKETRREYAENLMSLILELIFEEYSCNNLDWIDQIKESEEAIMIICWIVLCTDYWKQLSTELQLRMFQFIYDFYKLFFYQLYLDKNYNKNRKSMVKNCFCSIMSLDYYKNKLLNPLREMINRDLKTSDTLSDSCIRIFNLIHGVHLQNNVYCINSDNCFFGFNDDDISIVKNEELSANEANLVSFFTNGRSYRYYCEYYPESENVDNNKQDIKELISYRQLLVYTKIPKQRFMKMVTKIKISYYEPSGKIKENKITDNVLSEHIWNVLTARHNKSAIFKEITNILEGGYYISETQVVDLLYDIWELGAATIIVNAWNPQIKCCNRDECNIRREMNVLVHILEANPFYANFKEYIDLVELIKHKSLFFRISRLLISLLWANNIALATPYRQEEFTVLVDQLSFVRKKGFTDDTTIKKVLINDTWNILHRTTDFSRIFTILSESLVANADSADVSETQLRLQIYMVLLILWTKGLILLVTDSDNQDYENAFMKYMLIDNLYSPIRLNAYWK